MEGRKPRNGSSALIRHSMAQPLILTSAWASGSFLAVGNADHLPRQIQAGDQFGDRVLDLQAGVHFQEVELDLVAPDDELDRAGRFDGSHCARQRHSLLAHGLAHFGIVKGWASSMTFW